MSLLRKISLPLILFFVILTANALFAQSVLNPSQREPVRVPASGEQAVPNGDSTVSIVPADVPFDDSATGNAVVTGNGINYHGGPVLLGNPVPIYLIWYGTWNGSGSNTGATVSLVEHFIHSLGNTPYEHINSTYGSAAGNVSGNVTLGGAIFDTGSQGTALTNARLSAIVNRSFTNGLPKNPNGVYFVLTSSNVSEQGFCTSFCGFHTHQTLSGSDIKWAFVGNPDRCQSACEIQSTGPNSPATHVGGADGMINVITHEQEEAISDPDLNAWFDNSGQENADKCNFNFGATSVCGVAGSVCTPSARVAGARFNQSFGSNDWMIQQNWENAHGGGCVKHFP